MNSTILSFKINRINPTDFYTSDKNVIFVKGCFYHSNEEIIHMTNSKSNVQ